MKLHIVTLLLDGMPWLPCHLPVFNQLSIPWDWSVIEGVAAPVADTSWCKRIEPRVSNDGSHEYMRELQHYHPRVRYYFQKEWPGKTFMLNHALANIHEHGILLEVDVDEIWTAQQIENIVRMFENHEDIDYAQFHCRYFLGPNKIITSKNTYGNHDAYEWYRAWRYTPGVFFKCHEPPVYGERSLVGATHVTTDKEVGPFQHYAYATERQVAFKEQYYGYAGAVEQWKALQANTVWPCKAKDFLKWITDETVVDILK